MRRCYQPDFLHDELMRLLIEHFPALCYSRKRRITPMASCRAHRESRRSFALIASHDGARRHRRKLFRFTIRQVLLPRRDAGHTSFEIIGAWSVGLAFSLH